MCLTEYFSDCQPFIPSPCCLVPVVCCAYCRYAESFIISHYFLSFLPSYLVSSFDLLLLLCTLLVSYTTFFHASPLDLTLLNDALNTFRYSQFIVEYPSVVLLLVCLVVVISTGLGILLNEFPTFDDPTKGFEARGTVISGRLRALRRMQFGADGVYSCPSTSDQSNADLCSPHRVTRDIQNQTLDDDVGDDVLLGDCTNDLSSRVKMVYRSTDDSLEMFTSTSMKSVCQHDKENFRSDVGFDQICLYRTNGSCCPSISLGHVTALMVGKVDCDDVDDSDVLGMKELLEECVGYYSRGCLGGDGGSTCSDVPANCSADARVYTIFHYLTPTNFALQVAKGAFDLQTVIVLQPLMKGPFYGAQTLYEIYADKPRLTDDAVQVAAIDGGIKLNLFATYLFADTIYIGIGFLVVVAIIWMYVGSLFVTIMTMVSIIFSFVIAYFIYHTVFRLVFFPFINIITSVLLVGVGADDCFVYVDIWKLSKKEHGGGRENRVLVLRETLKHAATTMFVTSFTTASALFAGCISSITAVRCFSVFAGSSILVNFVLTVTWIPAAVMLHEKYFICDEEAQEGSCKRCGLWFFLGRIYDHVSRVGNKFFEEVLPIIIVKLRYLWILLLSGLGIGGLCVVFVEPRLRLPSQAELQLLRTSHILEQYDQIYKDTFSFESESENTMPAFIVWGIEPVDNGNHWDPDSEGTTVIDKNFDVKSPEAQTWLYDFCTDLRNASFHDNSATAPNEFCFIDLFKGFMEKTCIGDISPCCGQTTFPYSSSLFNQCVPIFYGIACQASESCGSYIPGLWFNSDNEVVGMVLTIKTNVQFSLRYDPIGQFWSDVNGFIEDRMAKAPSGLRRGWFISESGLQLWFFDLQQSLATGTPIAVGMSLVFAACVLLITIRNILVTIYAIYAIACAVFVVIATVVLLGWELNIFESTVLSLAVGLSVDFTVHLGVAYRQATEPDRTSRAMHALQTIGSAVTLAALTTLVAGASMLPATVLSYVQLGTFLIIIMIISWVYGLFLFMSLCRTIGPQGMFAQISTSCCRREPNLAENNLEMKPDEHVHEQHVNTRDERMQR
ncbi:protein dispatched homolog 1-like isoform X1 [Strongylocentrotus purpuratus]|uniref:SSD domain-containing protein n=1 Tax=Strongylocentrotus purpuratus TaxID=7668 RepID=A0A7M7P2Z9_STRPU|nr:protein dispatched homolog 1-like isoform X1 [Strongylocentrotus purpuratus]